MIHGSHTAEKRIARMLYRKTLGEGEWFSMGANSEEIVEGAIENREQEPCAWKL